MLSPSRGPTSGTVADPTYTLLMTDLVFHPPTVPSMVSMCPTTTTHAPGGAISAKTAIILVSSICEYASGVLVSTGRQSTNTRLLNNPFVPGAGAIRRTQAH